jgi:acyl carrier protein
VERSLDDHVSDTIRLRDLCRDSLEVLQLVLELENEFRVQIRSEELEKLVTMGDLLNLVESKKQ